MRAKKTTPKSIRFNAKNLEIATSQSGISSCQELVDFLLEEYCRGNLVDTRPNISEKPAAVAPTSAKEKLQSIIQSSPTKGYFDRKNLVDCSKDNEGIYDPKAPF